MRTTTLTAALALLLDLVLARSDRGTGRDVLRGHDDAHRIGQ